MKRCALCDRTTTPKNGAHNTSDAVLCHLCLATYEASPEYRREQHFRAENNEGGVRAALSDFIGTALKIRQVEHEKARNEQSLKEAAEKKAAKEAEKADSKSLNGSSGPQARA